MKHVPEIKQVLKRNGWRRLPDDFWNEIKPFLPKHKKSKKGGRPRADMRQMVEGVFYVLRTGCQWRMLPEKYGSKSTCHRYFQELEKSGFFEKIWKHFVKSLDRKSKIKWKWQAGDSHTVAAPVKGGP